MMENQFRHFRKGYLDNQFPLVSHYFSHISILLGYQVRFDYMCNNIVIRKFPGNNGYRSTLAEAKQNIVKHFLTVGITEQFADMLELLGYLQPELFKHALEIYKQCRYHNCHTNRSLYICLNNLAHKMLCLLLLQTSFNVKMCICSNG